jgi:hypothetical protein
MAEAGGIGHLPTPAEALDAINWPSEGGLERIEGPAPATVPRDLPAATLVVEDRSPPEEVVVRGAETRQERSSIASFFGFGAKPEKSEPPPRAEVAPPAPEATDAPKKRGWWQKRADG